MPITIHKKHPITHSLKVATVTIIFFLIIALILRLNKSDEFRSGELIDTYKPVTISSSLIPVFELPVEENSDEEDWNRALREFLRGSSEVSVDYGRVDVLTDFHAIEIDHIRKWKEGVGQALQYSEATGKMPVLALYLTESPDLSKIMYIDSFCQKKGIKLIILKKKGS